MDLWCRLVALVAVVASSINGQHMALTNGPCNFLNTVNISNGHYDQNGHYHHRGIVYKKGMFAEYNYVVENLTQLIKVEPHMRGCLCEMQPCVRICCLAENKNHSSCISTDTLMVPTHDEDEEINLSDSKYGILIGRPCGNMYKLEPQEYSYDKWYFKVSDQNS